ncbi:MAG: hypothetical protein EOO50_08160 [Flavobacterium sp.]|uniref:hypothetical protein n=1 Tax=Flavobacterium sp. TaxID=239 RepID=UPI0011FB863E|nr:hypothetical protein [Flavobacterium sp.]RZJ66850.1 MAG: hypothetical protein EOO50_08160 [Flavobacterium sp.]
MIKAYFALILFTAAYSQSNSISVETNIPFHPGSNLTYNFDEAGRLLSMVRNDLNNDQPGSSIFVYTDNLLTQIIINDYPKSGEIITYDFLYDEKKRFTAQKSSKEIDTIKFYYDDKNRLISVENYRGCDIQNKYGAESGLIDEKISKVINPELSGYYDITRYHYEPDKITEEKTFYNPYCERKPTVTIKEFKNKNVSKKTFYDQGNPGQLTRVTEYQYSKSGFLKKIIDDNDISEKFEVKCQNCKVSPEVVKKINLILLGDFESMNWY